MKKVTVLSSLLIAGALAFTGVQGTAQADEEEGAKTVWGEVLPADTDPDGDGWANTGFDVAWMTQEGQNRVSGLANSKDSGEISQVEFNEAVAEIFQIEQARQMDGSDEDANAENNSQAMVPHQKVDAMNIDVTKENLAKLALYSPATLDAAPVQEEPYHYSFVYGDYAFDFAYNGVNWTWSYDSVMDELTNNELVYLAHHDPSVLDERPVKDEPYDFSFEEDSYVYSFTYDGTKWTWKYMEK